MDISVIIVNYKTPNYVIDSIKSIKMQSSDFSYEIIVVDNASGDDSIIKITNAYSDVIIVPSNENLGTSKAYNLAISKSQGEYIFLLNPDTILLNNAIGIMYKYITKHSDTSVVCGNLYDLDNNPTHSYMKENFSLKRIKKSASIFYLISLRFKKNKYFNQFNFSNHPIEIGYACAAAMIMRKSDIEKVGCFDESIFMYGEEAALAYKLRKIGLKNVSIPEPKIMHFEGGSFNDKNKNNFSEDRYIRFITGNYNAFNIIEGKNGGMNYYKLLLRNERKLKFFYKFLNKEKYRISNKKIEIIKQKIDSLKEI